MFDRSGKPGTRAAQYVDSRKFRVCISALILATLIVTAGSWAWAGIKPGPGILAGLKVPFVANQGQTDPQVAFYAQALTGKVFVLRDGSLAYRFRSTKGEPVAFSEIIGRPVQPPQALDPSDSKVNILKGRDRSQWKPNLPTYNKVNLGQVAEGVRVELHARRGNVEKFFHFAPGSRPEDFRVRLEGSQGLAVLPTGELRVHTGRGDICFSRPVAFQMLDGNKVSVPVTYSAQGSSYGFILGEYDPDHEVVVDPAVDWATYLGGGALDASSEDHALAVTVDIYGYIYVTGQTNSSDFVSNPARPFVADNDAFLVKIQPNGTSLVYATFVGGSQNDWANGVAVDDKGVALITGKTYSEHNFPQLNALQNFGGGVSDAFITRLTANGADLVFSTFVGGSDTDEANAIVVDEEKNFYLVGSTYSTDFPATTGPAHQGEADVFVMKVSSVGTQFWSRLMGGPSTDIGYGVAVDAGGNTYIVGTTSGGFNTTGNVFQPTIGGGTDEDDAFVAMFGQDVSTVIYATYLGGSGAEDGRSIVVKNGVAHVMGSTTSTDFPTAGTPLQATHGDLSDADSEPDMFVSKIAYTAGNAVLSYSTFLGGDGHDLGWGMALDTDGNIYVVGETGGGSSGFPVYDAFQGTYGGGYIDAVVALISADGSTLVFASYLGGVDWDSAVGIALTPESRIVVVGETMSSTDFPVVSPYQASYGGGNFDAFVAQIDSGGTPPPVQPPPPNPQPFHLPILGRGNI